MANYCSLQEAYNTPSFSYSRKKKPCNLSPPPPTDMYEANRSEFSGKEFASFQGRGGREGFANGPGQAFESTYKAMQRDSKYYCNEYGVCAPGAAGAAGAIERFQSDVEEPVSRPKQSAKRTAGARSAPPSCPLQPPAYNFPMSDDSKAQFDAAMQTALDNDNERDPMAPLRTSRKVDMEGVDGYYDEELESYLKTKEMKAAPMPEFLTKASANEPKGFDKTPFAEAMSSFYKNKRPLLHPEPRPFAQEYESINFMQNLWDIALFTLAGILLILLMEQLYKLAIYQGMRQTIATLEPFLSQFRD